MRHLVKHHGHEKKHADDDRGRVNRRRWPEGVGVGQIADERSGDQDSDEEPGVVNPDVNAGNAADLHERLHGNIPFSPALPDARPFASSEASSRFLHYCVPC
jgi:hypothetical protein